MLSFFDEFSFSPHGADGTGLSGAACTFMLDVTACEAFQFEQTIVIKFPGSAARAGFSAADRIKGFGRKSGWPGKVEFWRLLIHRRLDAWGEEKFQRAKIAGQTFQEGCIFRLMLDIVIQVKGSEETLAHRSRDNCLIGSGFLIEVDRFFQGVHNDSTVLAFRDVTLDLFTKFLAEGPIHILG